MFVKILILNEFLWLSQYIIKLSLILWIFLISIMSNKNKECKHSLCPCNWIKRWIKWYIKCYIRLLDTLFSHIVFYDNSCIKLHEKIIQKIWLKETSSKINVLEKSCTNNTYSHNYFHILLNYIHNWKGTER